MRSSDFLQTLGVNTHVNTAPYDDPNRILKALDYIGFDNVRQSSPIDAASFEGIEALGKGGARIDLIINGGGPVNLAGAMQNVYQLAPYLNAVENVNEAAVFPVQYAGKSGVDAAVALQKDLYAAVHANLLLAGVPVYSFTIGGADPSAFPSIGDITPWTDYVNIHAYPPHGLRPIFVIHAAIDGGRTDAPSRPVVLTETGFYTLSNHVGWGGVPESVQASYLVDEVLDEAAAGVSRTYLYDLLDDGPDPDGTNQEMHFGLFNVDGSPKQSATAFHNLTTILADAGPAAATFIPGAFSFTATGVPYDYTGNTLLLDKSDGSHVIAVWNEQQLWNTETLTASAPQHFPTTVDLLKIYRTVLVFDPMVGTTPVQTLHDVRTVQLDLTDHPFLVQVMPDTPPVVTTPVMPPPVVPFPGGTSPVVISPPAPATPPVPPAETADTLVIHMSEDAWEGDAQFSITVNGDAVGGILSATARHGAGQVQDITIRGSFGSTAPVVNITFLNDAWGGTDATDRNLFVDGMTLNGVDVAGSVRSLYSAGATGVDTGSAQPARVATPVVVTFNLSEDTWMGDATAVISLDGNQLSAPVSVSALHGLGQTQQISFLVPLAAGPHIASVGFTNDAYGGTSDTDRNLYVDSIVAAGTTIPGATATLLSAGSQNFTLPVPQVPSTGSLTLTQGPVHLLMPISLGA